MPGGRPAAGPQDIQVPLLEPGQTGERDGLRFGAYAGPDWRAAVCTAGEEPLPERVWMGM